MNFHSSFGIVFRYERFFNTSFYTPYICIILLTIFFFRKLLYEKSPIGTTNKNMLATCNSIHFSNIELMVASLFLKNLLYKIIQLKAFFNCHSSFICLVYSYHSVLKPSLLKIRIKHYSFSMTILLLNLRNMNKYIQALFFRF